MPATTETVKSLSDDELDRLIDAGMKEKQARAERHKQETIARIRELAGGINVSISIGGTRGRPKAGAKPKARRAP